MELIGKNDHGVAEYDSSTKMVYFKFSGTFNLESTKELLRIEMSFVENNPAYGSVVDLSDMEGTFTAMNEFLVQDYFPVIIKLGRKCQSIIVPQDIFTKFAANSIIQKMGSFTMQTFGDREEAVAWTLQTAKEVPSEV